MPITKSAIKRMRQNIKRRRRNLHTGSAMKSEIKSLRAAIAEGNKKLVAERLSAAQSKIDKAAKKGVIHPNKAARSKAQLAKLAKEGKTKTARATGTKKPADSQPAATAKTAGKASQDTKADPKDEA